MPPQSFDSSAKTYDADFTNTNIGKIQRAQVWKCLLPLIVSPKNILEINCGTGEDALLLSAKGHAVLATDVSGKMIEVANEKLRGEKSGVRFVRTDFSFLRETVAEKKFDLLFSNFGGLNCVNETELKKLSNDFASVLNQNGKMFLVIMGNSCRWEQLYFILKLNFEKAFRRKIKTGAETKIGDSVFKTFYYSPAEIEKVFALHFEVKLIKPVGMFVPPSYLEPFFKNKKWLLTVFSALDNWLSSFSVFANQADHFIIVLQKKIF